MVSQALLAKNSLIIISCDHRAGADVDGEDGSLLYLCLEGVRLEEKHSSIEALGFKLEHGDYADILEPLEMSIFSP